MNAERNSRVLIILVAIVISSVFTTIAIGVASILFALARVLLPVLHKLPFLPFVLWPLTPHFLSLYVTLGYSVELGFWAS